MNKTEQKKLKQEYKAQQEKLFLESLPMEEELFLELFNYLDGKGETEGCENDFRLTKAFLKDKNVDIEKVIQFLEDNGGFCDCEVLYNVEELFEEV